MKTRSPVIAPNRTRVTHLLVTILLATLSWCGVSAAAHVRCQAMAGEPFGIGEISFPLGAADEVAWQSRGIRLTEASGRVLFPILEHPGLLRWLASRIEGDFPSAPGRTTIYFLFAGDRPLQLSLSTDPDRVISVDPEPNRPAKFGRMKRKWWKHIWGPLGERLQEKNRPRPVESYLAGMGIWRMGINRHPSIPETSTGTLGGLMMGTSRLRADIARSVSFDACCDEVATLPLPSAVVWKTVDPPSFGDIEVEDMAKRIPEECFYIRFGKYSNMLWATRLLEAHGEELQRLVTLNGFQGRSNEKIQSQLAIQELPFADLIGDQLIKDVALIGRDFYLSDGATFGVVLRSKSSVLAAGLASVRRDAVRSLKDQGATSESVKILGKVVSFISTPDNRLRSFHVFDDEWHLITNSEALVERFLRVPEEKNSLADLPSFRFMRSEMPAERSDSVFVYLSTHFMSGLASPGYVIELQRRIRSRAEIQMLEVAVRTARAEEGAWQGAGLTVESLDETADVVSQLKSRQLLPPGFACRSDGSELRWIDDKAVDSRRGRMGYFLPILDVPVESANSEEVRVFRRFAHDHQGLCSSLDPVAIRIRRDDLKENSKRERLHVEAILAPSERGSASILLGLLGKARHDRLAEPENALITGEVVLNGMLLPTRQDARLQLVVEDGPEIPASYRTRLTDLLDMARRLQMRLLVEPGEAAFGRRWWHVAGPPNDPYWRGPLDLVGRTLEDHAAVAFDMEKIRDLPPRLTKLDGEPPAQVALKIKELRGSSLDAAITAYTSCRAMRGSLRNLQRFHQWSSLLKTPLEQSPELVEWLVGMEPVCPLDGKYELRDAPRGGPLWTSTAFGEDSLSVYELVDYHPALLRWWRGLDAIANVSSEGLRVHAEVDVEFEKTAAAKPNGGFPFFGRSPKKK